MDLRYSPRSESFRTEVRTFLRANLPSGWRGMGALSNEEAESFSLAWRRTLSENGFLGITWPREYGGADRSKEDQVVLAEELVRARVPMGRVTDTTSLSSAIGAAKASVEDTRVARVQELAAQVSRGSYQPNAQEIADSILDEAMVDAELEAAG